MLNTSVVKSVLAAAVATSQLVVPTTSQDPSRPVFRGEANLVTVWATVSDRRGRLIDGLRKEDFVLSDDDQPQDIALFTQDTDTPLSVVLVVDVSGSMVDKLENVEDALRHFIAASRPDDEIALLEFSTRVDTVVRFGDPRERVKRELSRLEAQGGTALYDGAIAALDELRRATNRKQVMILLTDGNDNRSRASRKDAMQAMTHAEALVYALGMGHGQSGSFGHVLNSDDTVDLGVLKSLAEPTGGRAELIENAHRGGVDLVDSTIGGFERELRQQYTLGYYPTAHTGGNAVHRIHVSLAGNSEYTVRARTEYGGKSR